MYNIFMGIKEQIKKRLKQESEKNYKEFSASLIPNINNVLGIRLPTLRKIAKEIYLSNEYETFLKINNFDFNEEVMLQGMVIGYLNKPVKEIFGYIEDFVPKIDNWAVCDSFCSSLKLTKKNLKEFLIFLRPYFNSDKEYELRFAYVMLLSYFVEEEYLPKIFKLIDKFKDDKYYSKMAVAWLVSVCYAKYPKQTFEYLKISNLQNWTFNKSIQKICESYRVSKYDKNILKTMKK